MILHRTTEGWGWKGPPAAPLLGPVCPGPHPWPRTPPGMANPALGSSARPQGQGFPPHLPCIPVKPFPLTPSLSITASTPAASLSPGPARGCGGCTIFLQDSSKDPLQVLGVPLFPRGVPAFTWAGCGDGAMFGSGLFAQDFPFPRLQSVSSNGRGAAAGSWEALISVAASNSASPEQHFPGTRSWKQTGDLFFNYFLFCFKCF